MSKKNVALLDFEGDSNIGLYFFVNDHFALFGKEVEDKKKEEIQKVLGVDIITFKALGTDLVGVFLSGDNELLIAPELDARELEELGKICKKYDMKLIVSKELQNANGNSICVTPKRILIGSNHSKQFCDYLAKETKREVVQLNDPQFEYVGGVCTYANSKLFLAQELDEKVLEKLESFADGLGTVNKGSDFVSSGIVGNKNGVLVGSDSTPIEIQNILETLDYI